MVAQLGLELLFLLLQHRHLLLDAVALVAETLHGGAIGGFPPLNQATHLLADPVAFGLEIAALFLQIALLLGDQLQFGEVKRHAATTQLLGNQLRVVAQQTLVEHGL